MKEVSTLEFKLATEDDIQEIMKLYRDVIGSIGCTWSMDYPNEEIARSD